MNGVGEVDIGNWGWGQERDEEGLIYVVWYGVVEMGL